MLHLPPPGLEKQERVRSFCSELWCITPVLESFPNKSLLGKQHRNQSHKEESPGAVADLHMALAWCLLSLLGFMMSFFLCWPSPAAVFACGLGRRGKYFTLIVLQCIQFYSSKPRLNVWLQRVMCIEQRTKQPQGKFANLLGQAV